MCKCANCKKNSPANSNEMWGNLFLVYLFNYLFRLEHLTLHREMFKKLKMSKKTTGNDVFVIEKVYFCTLLFTIV